MANLTAVVFGCMAALGWGLGPITAKYAFNDDSSPLATACVQATIGMTILWILVGSTADLDALSNLSAITVLPFVLSGFIGSAIGRYLLYIGINRLGASINGSIAATDPLFGVLIAAIALNEIPTISQLFGGVIAVLGVVLVASSNGGNKSGWAKRTLLIPFIAAALYGTAAVIRRYGFIESSVSPIFASAINETTALIFLSMGLVASQSRRSVGMQFNNWKYLILTGFFYAGGSASLFFSLNAGPVVIGATLGSTAAVITVLGSALWLDDERITYKVAVGTLFAIIGITLISV